MSEGGKEAVRADDEVVAASLVRRLEERVRELDGCSAARPWRLRSSRRRLTLRGQKNRCCCRTRRFPEISGEDSQHDARRGALECDRTPRWQETSARTAGTCW